MFRITIENFNETHVRIFSTNRAVYSALQKRFSFTVPNAHFMKSKFSEKKWDGVIKLFNLRDQTIYKGLLREVLDFLGDEYGEIIFKGFEKGKPLHEFFDHDLISRFGIPEHFDPRDYAVEATHQALKQKRATIESPTSSGKSMLIYYLYRTIQLLDMRPEDKFLIVVPSVLLVDQMEDDFREYGYNGLLHKILGGKSKESDDPDCQLYVSTWQSLAMLPPAYFKKFKGIVVDEAHGGTAKEMTKIIEYCTSAVYRYGTSGTFKDCAINALTLRGLFGKNIVATTIQELKSYGYIADTNIVMHRIMYGPRLEDIFPPDCDYQHETSTILKSKQRDNIIMRIIESEPDKNGLVLFNTIKHGERLIEAFKKWFPDREYRVITGSVKREDRFTIKKEIDAGDLPRGTVVFATYGTMSTGVSIKNLDFGIFAHPLKSKIKILQSLGRLLRISDTKFKATLHDVWDDLTTISKKHKSNFGKAHAIERLQHYMEGGYEIDEMTHRID
uniref:DNA helicase n=1 Tax=Rhizobium phage LG08 TaxID=3129229 RepID=A0AAU8HY82_9CAUD